MVIDQSLGEGTKNNILGLSIYSFIITWLKQIRRSQSQSRHWLHWDIFLGLSVCLSDFVSITWLSLIFGANENCRIIGNSKNNYLDKRKKRNRYAETVVKELIIIKWNCQKNSCISRVYYFPEIDARLDLWCPSFYFWWIELVLSWITTCFLSLNKQHSIRMATIVRINYKGDISNTLNDIKGYYIVLLISFASL